MSEKAKRLWNGNRGRWYVHVRWKGKVYAYYRYQGRVPTGSDKSQPCQVAERIAQEINIEIDKGQFNPLRHKTKNPHSVLEYSKTWLKDIRVSAATLKDYRNSFRNHINPALGDIFIDDLNYDVLRKFQNEISRKNKGKKNVMGALHKMLTDAAKSGHITQVPIFPGFTGEDSIEETIAEWCDREIQEKILEHITPQDQPIFRFLMVTGCRPSEARAFRWCDIRPRHIMFRVTFDSNDELGPIKNKRQRRFPITQELAEVLADVPRNLTEYVFLNSRTGKPHTKNINRDFWNPACEKAGVNIKLNNAGRHSFANQMLESTDNISLVSSAMGHSNIGITKKHYGDHSLERMRTALDNVEHLSNRRKNGK